MTEEQWLSGTDSKSMLEYLKGRASDRKLRLFAVGCCRAVWDSLTHGRSKRAVEVAEQYADGAIDEATLARARSMAKDAVARHLEVLLRGRPLINRDALSIAEQRLTLAAETAHAHKPFLIGRLRPLHRDPELSRLAPRLLRDIFGNPFRTTSIDRPWQTSTVLALARQMYDARDFGAMPILADALQDAGCDDLTILNHCRSEPSHCRGCWAVDAILGLK